jgi:ABC-2 type transport system ATP-binding protein
VGLDPLLRSELWTVFRALADRGTTLIVSSHVMDEALRCDRLVLMRAGRIIADTTPGGLLADTGEVDPDAAFLALIERDAHAPAGASAADDNPASEAEPGHPLTRREQREHEGGER